MNKMSIRTTAVAIGLVLSLGSAASHADGCDLFSSGGFFANVGECMVPEAAPVFKSLDVLNGQMGNPFDHAAAQMANTFIPGAGSALEAGWALQRSGGFVNNRQPSYDQPSRAAYGSRNFVRGAPSVDIPPQYMYPGYYAR